MQERLPPSPQPRSYHVSCVVTCTHPLLETLAQGQVRVQVVHSRAHEPEYVIAYVYENARARTCVAWWVEGSCEGGIHAAATAIRTCNDLLFVVELRLGQVWLCDVQVWVLRR